MTSAELEANLALGRVREAFGVLARDGWYFEKTSAALSKRLQREVLDAIDPVAAKTMFVNVHPVAPATPHLSPLAFNVNGSLLVRTADGLVRVDGRGTVTPVEPATPLEPLELRLEGRSFLSVVYSCDRSEATLFFDGGPPSVTTLLAPRPGACGRAPRAPQKVARPAALGSGLSVLVGPMLIGDPGPVPRWPRGTARSPDGAWLVAPTPFGLLVDGLSHRVLGLGAGVDPEALEDCVVANGGQRVACVQSGRVLLATSGL